MSLSISSVAAAYYLGVDKCESTVLSLLLAWPWHTVLAWISASPLPLALLPDTLAISAALEVLAVLYGRFSFASSFKASQRAAQGLLACFLVGLGCVFFGIIWFFLVFPWLLQCQ
jgi:hypothetical protein